MHRPGTWSNAGRDADCDNNSANVFRQTHFTPLSFFAWVSCCRNARVFGDSSRLAWSQGWPESRNVAPIFGYTELDLCIEWSWPLVFERFSIRFAWVWLDIDNGQFLAWPGAVPYLRSQSSGVSQLSSLLYRLLPTQLQLKDLCFTPLHGGHAGLFFEDC